MNTAKQKPHRTQRNPALSRVTAKRSASTERRTRILRTLIRAVDDGIITPLGRDIALSVLNSDEPRAKTWTPRDFVLFAARVVAELFTDPRVKGVFVSRKEVAAAAKMAREAAGRLAS